MSEILDALLYALFAFGGLVLMFLFGVAISHYIVLPFLDMIEKLWERQR